MKYMPRVSHDLTGKINISANGGYARTTYEGDYSYHGTVGKREDDEYSGGLAIDYQIQRWLRGRQLHLFRQGFHLEIFLTPTTGSCSA